MAPTRNASFGKTLFSITILVLQIFSACALPITPQRKSADNVRLVQYVQTFHTNGDPSKRLSLLPLIKNKTSVTHVILAALHINASPGEITLNDQKPESSYYDAVWSEVKTLQQSGVKVMVMMGGAARGSYANRLCKSDGQVDPTYYSPLLAFLRKYNIQGVDLDIEEPVLLSCAVNLIEGLKKDVTNFIVTLAPVASDLTPTMRGLSGFNYKALETSRAGPLVDWYNTQYYSGFVEGSIEQSYSAAVDNGFAAKRIVVGLLQSATDGTGFLSLSAVQGTISNILQSHPIAGVDGWEYFNAGSSDGFVRPTRWLKEIAKTLLSGVTTAGLAVNQTGHFPPLPKRIQQLMHEGYGQIEAAAAVRLAEGHAV